ncbi:unnamed protein product [Porites evermanni]|uniref:TNFR-Cys domain-containing protein n=1 Tax=Porites evermanni TaxID=104178 RepID=A0ABN8M5E4_9CNID|nr:unnamed protein product [Porites evermanni]
MSLLYARGTILLASDENDIRRNRFSKCLSGVPGIVILVYGSSVVSCKRQKPKHDEIERVINKTQSVIWKCSVSECHPGSGLSFPCGVSIPFSESIECVYCGFYWNKITDSCDPCSDCCRQPLAHHEKQCEDSGLPVSHQCRQSHVQCQHPTGTFKTDGKLFQPDDHKVNRLSSSSIAGIVVSCVLLVVMIIVLGFVTHKWIQQWFLQLARHNAMNSPFVL